MSLFARLFALRSTDKREQEEDYLTEIIAAVLNRRPLLFWHWLEPRWQPLEPDDTVEVHTQVRQGHQSESRIDLVLTRRRGEMRSVAYVESKVAAAEGNEQLRRYASHLSREVANERLLVYATRSLNHKSKPDGLADPQWLAARWHTLYRHLDPVDSLEAEAAAFMRHLRLDIATMFSPADLFVLQEAPRVLKAFGDVLKRVSSRFEGVVGVTRDPQGHMGQVRKHDRLILFSPTPQGLNGMIGFWMTWPDGVPRVRVLLETPRLLESDTRARAVRSFDLFCTLYPDWKATSPEGPFTTLGLSMPLTHFLTSSNHADALVKWFEERLVEMAAFPDFWEAASPPPDINTDRGLTASEPQTPGQM